MKRTLAMILLVLALFGSSGCHRIVGQVVTAVAATALYIALEDLQYYHYHQLESGYDEVYCEVDHDGYHHYEWRGHRDG